MAKKSKTCDYDDGDGGNPIGIICVEFTINLICLL